MAVDPAVPAGRVHEVPDDLDSTFSGNVGPLGALALIEQMREYFSSRADQP